MNRFLETLRDDAKMTKIISTRAGRKMLKNQLDESMRKAEIMEDSLADAREEQRLLRKWIGGIELRAARSPHPSSAT